jgi:predicted transposase/invertase (TIGR01784 family)
MNTASKPTRYLDPTIDLAFKRLFGDNVNLLKSFLNALLPLPDDAPIESLEYLTTEQAPVLPLIEKSSIVDVKCKDVKGRTFIVEMQMLWTASFKQRVLFNGANAYVRQLKRGQDYSALQPVYALSIINSIFETDTSNHYHHYKIISAGEPAKTIAGLEFLFIELPKFKPETSTDKRMARLWLRFMNEIGDSGLQIPDPSLTEIPEIAQALELIEESALSPAELAGYHHSLDEWRTTVTIKHDAHAKGKAEATIAIALALKAQGVDAAVIMAATGLSAADVAGL